jgi:hypothetical protein
MTDLLQTVEADVVGGLKAAGAFLSGVLAKLQSQPNANPASVAAVRSAQDSVSAAAADITSAIPALAEEAVTLVLSLIPGNSPYAPLEDAFIQQVIASLTGKTAAD